MLGDACKDQLPSKGGQHYLAEFLVAALNKIINLSLFPLAIKLGVPGIPHIDRFIEILRQEKLYG